MRQRKADLIKSKVFHSFRVLVKKNVLLGIAFTTNQNV